ncbi:peroxidasin homolog [Anabrus simplex]|uniref:peroxidasin homolog n=1 Tax=Anabrus simplex TaxID=316456 RepID=UPI0034DDBA15
MDKMMRVTKTMFSRLETLHLVLTILLLSAVESSSSAYTWGHPSVGWSDPDADGPPPKFESTPTSITALVGQTVYLPCTVTDLGDKVVSWIRTRDLHILTSGRHTYTSDGRFEVLHKPDSDGWNLRIMGVALRDEGQYECQVNTDPKMKHGVLLSIRENDMRDSPYNMPEEIFPSHRETGLHSTVTTLASAKVLGKSEQFVHIGSTVTFTCLVEAPYPQGRPPRVVNWFHGKRLVSFQADRGGISMDTEKTDIQTVSRLTVADVKPIDAGNYTCLPTDVRPATVSLIVMEGEHTEAMQRDGLHSSARPSTTNLERRLATFLCILHWWWRCWQHVVHVT